MRNYVLLFFLCAIGFSVNAQGYHNDTKRKSRKETNSKIRMGFKAGVSQALMPEKTHAPARTSLPPTEPGARLSVTEAGNGVRAGFFARARFGSFVVQPEVMFSSVDTRYLLTDDGGASKAYQVTCQHLDLPLLMGAQYGVLRLQAGPVAQLFIAEQNGFEELPGFDTARSQLTYGYQAGAGLDLWKFSIDARYQDDFRDFGQAYSFDGKQHNFGGDRGRFLLSLGLTF